MLDTITAFLTKLQHMITPIPYLNKFCELERGTFFLVCLITALVLVLFIIALIAKFIRGLAIKIRNRHLQNFFGIFNLSQFKVIKMGRPGTKYYRTDCFNTFILSMPHWKYAEEDGSKRKGKRLNKVVYEESMLWLHAGRKVYVICTKDPWNMLYLVHNLRETGLDISACQQELDKQEWIKNEGSNVEGIIGEVIEEMHGEREAFVEFCRQRLSTRGLKITDAPKNSVGIDLFTKKDNQANVISCVLVPRDHLTSLDEMKAFKSAMDNFFADNSILITTGHITVAAAGFAREYNIEIICNDQLAELIREDKELPPEKAYLRWEINDSDIKRLLPDDLQEKVFS